MACKLGKARIGSTGASGLRQAIYRNGQQAWKFHDTQTTYAEAFEACFGERLDRRAVMRDAPLDEEP